jgi:REP-associated tyrosine transposase
MPNLRHVYAAAYPYLTTTVTFSRIPVFTESEAADILLRAIFFGKKQQWYYLLSFVIMPDHMHLIIIPRDKDISQCMKSIKGFSARQINEVFSRKGTLWQSGFYDYILDSEEKVLSRIRYVEGNPVRKGMVGCPEEYRYS